MKLKDFLKVMDKEEIICLGISAYGMRFKTERFAGFFRNSGDELNNMEITSVYARDGRIHIELKD